MLRLPLLAVITTVLMFAGCVAEPVAKDILPEEKAPVQVPVVPKTESEEFTVTSWATPVRAFNNGGPSLLIKPGTKNVTGFMVEVSWTPSSQASTRMSVWIRKEGDGAVSPNNPTFLVNSPPPLKQVDGTSPLKVPLPQEIFKDADNYQVVFRAAAAPVGVAVQQPGKLHLTTFVDVPFDEKYSALPK